ncbi:MAG: xanthine dehydrogenase family protein molybdopterin-binding subunit [Candidatus Eremiobacteraeota bacterium]|nr:xanthine dehydrogenase family protein molybdopterin-binding subunit [Candidatus Eremiobacteraeota bacterium]
MELDALDRGGFLRLAGTLGAGLVFAVYLPGCGRSSTSSSSAPFAPNAWVRIAPDNTVTVVVNKSEMGQGVATGLPTIVADELDADPNLLKFEFAPADQQYIDPVYGAMITGGSTSVKDMWMPLRTAGATARAMLIAAAAQQWSLDPSACTAKNGVVYHSASNRTASYGSLTAIASGLKVPTNVPLKRPDQFTIIGQQHQRLDIPQKLNGTAEYGIDVRVPGMLYAAIARSPVFGGKVKSFDPKAAKAVAGVVDVVQVSNGVAVVAKNTWSAFQGKNALQIDWDDGPNANLTTEALFAEAEELARTHRGELVALSRGNTETAKGTVVEATYRGPFLAHTTMEPQNATADVREDRCEVWAPNQVQQRSQQEAVNVTGLPLEKCVVHTTLLGGGFGRRLESDYVREAVEVSKAVKAPVKVMWTREDDIQNEFYRPMSVNVVRGVLANGTLTSLSHQVVSQSWLKRWHPQWLKNGVDMLSMAEAVDAPYYVPNFKATFIDHEHGIPVGSWRAPDANWNGFVTESFIDELAHAAGKDPLTFRLALFEKTPRAAGVLRLAAEKAGWGKRQGAGIAQGLAVVFWGGSYAALVADVSMVNNMPKVHRVVAAVDCGTVINPRIVEQQAQSAVIYGLSAALTNKITLERGRVQQHNFYDYLSLRLADSPPIDVYVVPSKESPTGVGELCTPPIAPAVANAVFTLTGKRVRQLPFSDALRA